MDNNNLCSSNYIIKIFQKLALPQCSNQEKLKIVIDAKNYMQNVPLDKSSNVYKLFGSTTVGTYKDFLIFCSETNKLFCLLCVCFGNKTKRGPKSGLTGNGMVIGNMAYKHINERIINHVDLLAHKEALEQYTHLICTPDIGAVMFNSSGRDKNFKENRHVLKTVINTVIFLVSAGINFSHFVQSCDIFTKYSPGTNLDQVTFE
jgi:hypothetical protein